VDTGVDIKTTTNGSGSYTIPYLHYGNYTVTAEKDGFKEAAQTGINLHVYETSTVNFTLQVGKVTEIVTVNADTVLDVGKADQGEVVENMRVTELPLNGRNTEMLAVLAAGVNFNYSGYTRPWSDAQQYTSMNGGGTGNVELLLDGTSNNPSPINISGGQSDFLGETGYTTPVDSVQEFKLVTGPYDASYGLNSGGVEEVILKSGTNKIHGDVYEFARRTWMDANSWQNDYYYRLKQAQGASASSLAKYKTAISKQDQYGFELDGPIVIPKIYNGKNKSFFTVQWEHFHALSPLTDTASVPDGDWSSGNFSNLDRWNGSSYEPKYIFDPTSGAKDTVNKATLNSYVRKQFDGSTPTQVLNSSGSLTSVIGNTQTGNVIPSGQIDKMAQKVLQMYPKCYKTGTSFLTGAKSDPNCVVVNGSQDHWNSNYVLSTFGDDLYNNILLKWDQHWTDKDRFTLRYGYWMWNNTYNGNGLPSPLETGDVPKVRRSHTFALEEVHTFTPNLLLAFKANVIVRDNLTRLGVAYDATQLGWTQSEVDSMGTAAKNEFPVFAMGGQNCYTYSGCDYTYGGSYNNVDSIKNSMNLFPDLTWIKGKHTIHGGIDIRLWQDGYKLTNGGPAFTTGSNWTYYTANHANSIQNDGNSAASFLMGVPDYATNTINPTTYLSEHYWAPFIQDDWKITRKLTLNLGFRWDWLPAEVERHNKGNYAFDTVSVNPDLTSVQISGHGNLTGGITFLGVNGNPRSAYRTINTNYQPRFGFTYALNNNTVLRGGFGKSMQAPQNATPTQGFSATTNGTTSNPNYGSGVYQNLQNPLENVFWGGVTGSVLQPSGASSGLDTDLGQGISTFNPHTKTPSFWSYSLGIERQIGRSSSVNASYVGSRLYDGTSSSNINRQDNSLRKGCSPLYGGDPNNCSTSYSGRRDNPFYGMSIFAGSGYDTNKNISNLDLSRSRPQFQDVTQYLENDARTWYNSLQITVLHKFSNTLTLHGTDTWSRTMDAGSWQDNNYGIRQRHVDSNDIGNRITLSGVFMLPIGRGRMLLPNANRIVDEAIGGWELSGMAILQSGMPQSVPTYYLHNAKVSRHRQKNNGYIRVFAPYAEKYVRTGSTYIVEQYQGNGTNYNYDGTNPGYANFMDVPSYAPSQDVDYSGIREAGVRKFDISLSKNFAIREGLKLQVRWDSFNILNHPEWTGGASTSTSDSNLGAINVGPTGSSIDPRKNQISAKIVW
jgi:hypothetical protein